MRPGIVILFLIALYGGCSQRKAENVAPSLPESYSKSFGIGGEELLLDSSGHCHRTVFERTRHGTYVVSGDTVFLIFEKSTDTLLQIRWADEWLLCELRDVPQAVLSIRANGFCGMRNLLFATSGITSSRIRDVKPVLPYAIEKDLRMDSISASDTSIYFPDCGSLRID